MQILPYDFKALIASAVILLELSNARNADCINTGDYGGGFIIIIWNKFDAVCK